MEHSPSLLRGIRCALIITLPIYALIWAIV